MSEFKLLLDRLTDRPQRFAFRAEPRWWSARLGESEAQPWDGEIDRPFDFELAASRLGDGVLIEGTFTGGLTIECSRCTRRYAHALRDAFRLVLKPRKEDQRGEGRGQTALDPEAERAISVNGICLGDDLEAGWFRGPVVFLDDFFAEVVATAMPIQPLCDETCPGLCPHCGMERRRGAGADAGVESLAVCACEDERIDSPFAALASLRGSRDGKGISGVDATTVAPTNESGADVRVDVGGGAAGPVRKAGRTRSQKRS